MMARDVGPRHGNHPECCLFLRLHSPSLFLPTCGGQLCCHNNTPIVTFPTKELLLSAMRGVLCARPHSWACSAAAVAGAAGGQRVASAAALESGM